MLDLGSTLVPTEPILELVVRGTITYLVLTILLRIVGQREAGGLGITDLLVVVLVSDAASSGLTGSSESIGDGLIGVVPILLWSVALDALSYRDPWLDRLIKARPRTLIEDGEVNQRAMHREFMTREELLSQLRTHGIEDPSGVHRAYLEPSGLVSVIPEPEERTVDGGSARPAVE